MIVDTSAVLAILFDEADAQTIGRTISYAEARFMSSASYVEAGIVAAASGGKVGLQILRDLVRQLGISIVPTSVEHATLAQEAFLRFGKGRHPAALNFGDCFSYALAVSQNQPLLFKGDDFSKTDVPVVA